MIKIVEYLLPASTRLLVYLFTYHTFLRGYKYRFYYSVHEINMISAQNTGEVCQRSTVIGQQRLIVELFSQNNTCVIWPLPNATTATCPH